MRIVEPADKSSPPSPPSQDPCVAGRVSSARIASGQSYARRKGAGDVCLFSTEAPAPFQQAPLGSRACCIPDPALRLRTCEGGSGCDDLSGGPRSLSIQAEPAASGRCVFVICGPLARPFDARAHQVRWISVKKSITWKSWRGGSRVQLWPGKRNGPRHRERMKS